MFAQLLFQACLIGAFGYFLWKYVGKSWVEKLTDDDDSTEEVSSLQAKIEELEKKKNEIVSLQEEVKTTTSLVKIDEQLTKLKGHLTIAESKRTETES